MSEPARDGLFQSCDIIIRRRSYLEFSICTPHALAIRNDCHYCDRFRATRVRHVERLDTYSSAGRDSAFAFDERDVADVFKCRDLPPPFFRRFVFVNSFELTNMQRSRTEHGVQVSRNGKMRRTIFIASRSWPPCGNGPYIA